MKIFNRFITSFILILCLAGFGSPAGAVSPAEVNLVKKAVVDGDDISLGDISSIHSSDPKLVEILRRIVIARSPLPNSTKTLSKEYILTRLKQHKVDLAQVRVRAVRQIDVARSSMTVPKKRMVEAIESVIGEKIAGIYEAARIQKIKVPQPVLLPKGTLSIQIDMGRNTRLLGAVPVAVSLYVDKKYEKKIWATAYIEALTDVVVVKKALGRYQTIDREHLAMEKRDLAKLPESALLRMADAVGKRTTRSLFPKAVVKSEYVELPPMVRRGDLVTIIAESSEMKLRTRGVIKETGRKGDRIRVANMDSNKIIYARVFDSGTVIVDF
ncbi:MAG: flagellar basal body P-ring formation protein FlgA [Desulfobacteraceae bacterium]|nr:flagellar basal body P-ring formation protein FlgA [Desulfobacteraceae bacterium]